MHIRLVASDVDGTILPRGGAISERTICAVHRLIDAGIPYVISTGRWFVSAKVIADALRLEGGLMIIANGGAVVDLAGHPLREWTLTEVRARRAYEILRKENVMVNAFVPDAVYRVNTHALKNPPKGLGDYLGGAYHMVNDDQAQFEEKGLLSVYKLEAYGDDRDVLDALKAKLEEEGYSVTSAYWTNIEVMDAGCGKGTALNWLGGHLGVSREERMAFGDNLNDLQLLTASGWPVAMGNAVPALKDIARIIAPEDADDGEAQIIEQMLEGRL